MAWTDRFVRADASGSGDGTADSSGSAWTFAQAVANVTGGMRVNVRAGTYSLTTTTLQFSVEGTKTSRMWWRGFSTSPGDLDNDFTTTKPQLSFTTGYPFVFGDYQFFSNLHFNSSNPTNYMVQAGGFGCHWHRCRFTTAGDGRVDLETGGQIFNQCYIEAPTTATRAVYFTAGNNIIRGCAIVGGVIGVDNVGSGNATTVLNCTVRGASGVGVSWVGGSTASLIGNTIAGCGSHGININVSTAEGVCIGNLLSDNTGSGINIAAGNHVLIANNSFYSNAAEISGLGDIPNHYPVTESSDPLTNLAGGDLSLVSGALSRGAGMGGFENTSYTSYLDIGAVQSDAAGSGGGLLSGNMRGNFQ